MKKIIHLTIFSLFLLLTCAFTKGDKWYKFESKVYGFKVDFPKEPSEQTRRVNSEAGEADMHLFVFDASKEKAEANLAYLIAFTTNPDSTINSDNKDLSGYFRRAIDGAVNGVHGKLLTESIITLDGFPGREVRVDFKDGMAVIKMRIYLVHNSMFMLEVITETSQDFNLSINRFLDSFKLIKQVK